MQYQSYGQNAERALETQLDRSLEELAIVGYSIVEGVLPEREVDELSLMLDEVWERQLEECGRERMVTARDWGICRALVHYDMGFARLIRHPLALDVLRGTIGETAILHLINGIVIFPGEKSHQGKLHRDFAKPFTSDKLLSVNMFWILDEFSHTTGGTWFVPHTHQISHTHSAIDLEKHAIQIKAPRGSVVVFDSRVLHKAGFNSSEKRRRALNLQYTRPFIKQQVDLAALMRDRVDPDSPLAQTLGMWSVPPASPKDFRVAPEKRSYRPGQG